MRGVHKRVRTNAFPSPPPPIISPALPLASFCWVFRGWWTWHGLEKLPPTPTPAVLHRKREDERNLNQTQARVCPIRTHAAARCPENVRRFGKLHVGWGVRVWQQQGARGGGRGQAEGTRARDGLLGQNQEAGQPGHIPFPLADELSIQNAGEGRERHLLLIGGSNEHAESVPVVGQFQDVVVTAVGGGKLSWERHQDGALAITPAPVDSNPALAFPLVLPAPPSSLEASSPSWLLRLPTHPPPPPALSCSVFLFPLGFSSARSVSSGRSVSGWPSLPSHPSPQSPAINAFRSPPPESQPSHSSSPGGSGKPRLSHQNHMKMRDCIKWSSGILR